MSTPHLPNTPRKLWIIASPLFAAIALFTSSVTAVAQTTNAASAATVASSGTGTISGRVYKPSTGEYVRGAIVSVEGTDLSVESGNGGNYQILGVPAGSARLAVTFTGYITEKASVDVAAGQAAVKDFELLAPGELRRSADPDQPLQLSEFRVSSQREGNAKALQAQKNAMHIMNHVSSDAFGDVPEGNVGEFLKNLPGVDLDYTANDAKGVRLRGMDPQYVGVTLDGIKLASADAFGATIGTDNNGTEGSRGFGFESVSLSSVDSLELYKALTADMDASTPAGAINMRSKRAFDIKGRRITWQTLLTGNSEEFNFKDSYGPGDARHRKIRPGGAVEYSDVFFNKRLGIRLNLTHSDVYNEQHFFRMGNINRTAGTDTRIAIPRTIEYIDSPKLTKRFSGTFTLDYKLTSRLDVGFSTVISKYEATTNEQSVTFNLFNDLTAPQTLLQRNAVIGANPMVEFQTATTVPGGTPATSNSSVTLGGVSFFKITDAVTFAPRFDYRVTDKLTLEGRFGYSYSNNDYEGIERGQARTVGVTSTVTGANGLVFRGVRPSMESSYWSISQVAGPDFADLSNYVRPSVSNEGRIDINEVTTGRLDANYVTGWKWLTLAKVGVKSHEERRYFQDARNWNSFEYVGPGGIVGTSTDTGSWAGYPGTTPFDFGSSMPVSVRSISGRGPSFPGRTRIAQLFRSNPEYFVRRHRPSGNPPFSQAALDAASADAYYTSFYGQTRKLKERVDATYLTGVMRIKKLQLQPGLRWEQTNTNAAVNDPLSRDEMVAAGYAVRTTTTTTSPTGVVTTTNSYTLPGTSDAAFSNNSRYNRVDGLIYQFERQPKKNIKGKYDHFFTSVAGKYNFTPNLQAQVGFYEAIQRPSLSSLTGAFQANETTRIISVPNPDLLPEESKNYSSRLAYYFEPVGSLSVAFFQTDIRNFSNTFDFTASEDFAQFGLDPAEYPDYTIRTRDNAPGSRRFRVMEVEYGQTLSFLPGPLSGLRVSTNYTRSYGSVRRGGIAPHQIGGSLSYTWRRFSTKGSFIWTPDTPWSQNVIQQYRDERTMYDMSASYKVTDRITLSVSGRNITDVPFRKIEKRPEGRVLTYEDFYGTSWTMSLRGTF